MESKMAKNLYPTNTKKSSGMSGKQFSLGSGKMSGAHGVTNGGGKHKTLKNASGAVGSTKRTFDRCFDTAPNNIGKGHKDKY